MTKTKNILLIGKTGSGKSTLANVLINKNNQFKEVFKEGKYGVSQTKKVHAEEFKHEGIKYKIIDTVGISDTKEGTKMSLNKILYNLAKVGYVVKDGLSQIWLVIDGTSSIEQTNSLYNLLKETVFDENIAQFTTIIRTRFENFEEEDECAEDRRIMLENSRELEEVIEKGVNKIIHVDNPPLSGRSVGENKKTREESRKILLKFLTSYESIYKPANLDKLNKIIAKEWKDKELLKEKINKGFIKHIKERGASLKEEVKDELKRLQEEIEERELKEATLKESELSKQIGSQLVRELRELGSYLPENEKLAGLKERINQLREEIIGDEERELVGKIIINRENIIEALKENIKEKKEHLQKVKNIHGGKTEESTKKSKSFLDMSIEKVIKSSNFFSKGDYEEAWSREEVEKICQAQTELNKSETELEIIKKVLEIIEVYKENLDQQLEARVEITSK